MTNPCDSYKKRQSCTQRCFVKKDYDRGMKRRKR